MSILFWFYSTAPPEHSLSRCSETAGKVRKGLGFGVQTLRLQKTAATARTPAVKPAATASRVGGLLNVFLCYSTAPPSHSLSRRLETAGEVWKDLGFGV